MIGTTVSHYRILRKLGEGGMGVVYKAHDTKLDRDVALKFLPRHITATADEQARFLQEARAASALNHPNICGIHSIGEDRDTQFIEMEYVDGKTLRQIVPLQKAQTAIDYAIQIGDALQEAHSKGIVHRDIKTDNIMVNSKNQIKVMDFGLGKLKGSLKLTKTSSTVGTLAYMAPEQIEGGEIDARSDIFSFGVVLFEMLTGHLPFRGEHEAAMMYSIVNEEAIPLQQYVPDASSELVHIVNRVLEKDPNDRYQTVQDMVIDLRRLKKDSSRVSRVKEPPKIPTEANASIQKGRYTRRTLVVGGGFLAVFLACLVVIMETRTSKRTTWDLASMRRIKTPSAVVRDPDISPDGNWIVYVARDQRNHTNLYVVHVSGGEPKKLTNDTTWSFKSEPCFSLDASAIIYVQGDDAQPNIYTVPTLGGHPTRIIGNGVLPVVSPDGRHIAFLRFTPRTQHVMVSQMDGSSEKEITRDSVPSSSKYSLSWSPDGRRIGHLHNFRPRSNEFYNEIFTCDVATGEERQITSDKEVKNDICWTSTDEFVYACYQGQSWNLMVIPTSGGAPMRLTFGSGSDFTPRVSRDGKRLVYANTSWESNLWTIDLQTKKMSQLTFEDEYLERPKYSPDRKRILYRKSGLHAPAQLFICNTDGTDPIQVTHVVSPSKVHNYGGLWAGDGRSIAYTVTTIDTVSGKSDSVVQHILVQDISTGSIQDYGNGILHDWSQDGKYMLVANRMNAKEYVLAPSRSLEKPTRLIESYGPPFFTHDSKSVIYTDSAFIWSLSIDNGQVTRLRTRPPGIWAPSEMPDGKSLFHAALYWQQGKWILFKISKVGSHMQKLCEVEGQIGGGDVSPDMQKVIFSKQEQRDNIILIDKSK